jgi:enterochelin esterase-like enzyme
VTVYVPAQYDPAQPACLYVNQDGVQYKAPTVFDNLIHRKEIPVTIGVFVMHGRVRAAQCGGGARSFQPELTSMTELGDNYARFLIDELLPAVEKMKTADGRGRSGCRRRAADRAIGGSSSGAIRAFTAAWERPDSFSRVFSAIGTYVGLRGGDHYHSLVTKSSSRSRSASSFRMGQTIRTATPVTGSWPIRRSTGRSSSAATRLRRSG